MHNCFLQGFVHEKIITKSDDFFLNGSMFMQDCGKGVLKIEKNNCIIPLRILIQIFLNSFMTEAVIIKKPVH